MKSAVRTCEVASLVAELFQLCFVVEYVAHLHVSILSISYTNL